MEFAAEIYFINYLAGRDDGTQFVLVDTSFLGAKDTEVLTMGS